MFVFKGSVNLLVDVYVLQNKDTNRDATAPPVTACPAPNQFSETQSHLDH